MLALSAAALPVQLGKDWTGMHAARIAATTLPLLLALAAINRHDNAWLLGGACAVAALLAIAGGLILLPATKNAGRAGAADCGRHPAGAGLRNRRRPHAGRGTGGRLGGRHAGVVLLGSYPRIVTQIWSAWSAISALVAVTVAFAGYVEGPVLLALAVIVAIAGRHDVVARWSAAGFGIIGAGLFYSYAPLPALVRATTMPTSVAVSTLAASLLVIAFAVVIARA